MTKTDRIARKKVKWAIGTDQHLRKNGWSPAQVMAAGSGLLDGALLS
jgi:hypothetical protein